MIRYDDIDRVFTTEERDRQELVIKSVFELLIKLNPTKKKIEFDITIFDKLLVPLLDIFTEDLSLCTERQFYP